MRIKMKKNNLKFNIYFFFFIIFSCKNVLSDTIVFSKCKSIKEGFIKNEYILDLDNSLMTRNYEYNKKTFEKYKITDLSVKKENSIKRFIYKEENLILTDKIGYPQFYTQLVFEKDNPIIKIKTVINNVEGTTKISTCENIEVYESKI